MNHILTHSDEFEKPPEIRAAFDLLGDGMHLVPIYWAPPTHSLLKGLIIVEGEKHRKQVSSITLDIPHSDLSPSLLASHHGMHSLSETSPVL